MEERVSRSSKKYSLSLDPNRCRKETAPRRTSRTELGAPGLAVRTVERIARRKTWRTPVATRGL
ncbi:MAG: hypothetical protein ACLFWG_11235 [Longimicrobiales bacterium]